MRITLITIVLCSLISCKKKEEGFKLYPTDQFKINKVDIREFEAINLNIPAEVNIGKNVKFIDNTESLIVFDESEIQIYVINLREQTSYKIGRYGDAPFEYLDAQSIEIENDSIYVFSANAQKLNIYHFNGEFIQTKRLNFFATSFDIVDGRYIFDTGYNFSDFSGTHLLLALSSDFQNTEKKYEISITPQVMIGFSGFFAHDKLHQLSYFSHGMSDTIHVMNERLETAYNILITNLKNPWPHGFEYSMFMQDPKSIDYSWINNDYVLANGNLFLTVVNNRKVITQMMNLKNKVIFDFDESLIQFLKSYMISTDSREGVYYALLTDESLSRARAGELSEMFDSAKFPILYKLLLSDKLEDGNPVLYKFKIN
jgi:hypothetical protein